jgi:hypothetical protein
VQVDHLISVHGRLGNKKLQTDPFRQFDCCVASLLAMANRKPVIASAARQSMTALYRRWIATACGLAMTEKKDFEILRSLCDAPAVFNVQE